MNFPLGLNQVLISIRGFASWPIVSNPFPYFAFFYYSLLRYLGDTKSKLDPKLLHLLQFRSCISDHITMKLHFNSMLLVALSARTQQAWATADIEGGISLLDDKVSIYSFLVVAIVTTGLRPFLFLASLRIICLCIVAPLHH